MVAVLAQLTRYKIKDGGRGVCKSRMERLVILYVNYTRTPDNLVKSSAFYTRSLSVRSQMVAPVAASQLSLRDHRMIVHHKLREQSVAFHNNTTGNSTLLNIAQTIDI